MVGQWMKDKSANTQSPLHAHQPDNENSNGTKMPPLPSAAAAAAAGSGRFNIANMVRSPLLDLRRVTDHAVTLGGRDAHPHAPPRRHRRTTGSVTHLSDAFLLTLAPGEFSSD